MTLGPLWLGKGLRMNDRELLEAAARAAGITLMWSTMAGIRPRNVETGNTWSPLTDDGDSLRLAVKIGLIVSVFRPTREHAGFTVVELDDAAGHRARGIQAHYTEQHTDEPHAATRRAIVRAAAAIGAAK